MSATFGGAATPRRCGVRWRRRRPQINGCLCWFQYSVARWTACSISAQASNRLPLRARANSSTPNAGVDVEVVDHGVDPLGTGHDPALDLLEEVDPVRGGPALVGRGEGGACGRLQGAEYVARDIAPAVVDLLSGPLRLWPGRLDQALPGIALARLRSHLVEADDYAALWRRSVELLDGPLFSAKSGSSRAPNQVSSWRHLRPSARSNSLTRGRHMPIPGSLR